MSTERSSSGQMSTEQSSLGERSTERSSLVEKSTEQSSEGESEKQSPQETTESEEQSSFHETDEQSDGQSAHEDESEEQQPATQQPQQPLQPLQPSQPLQPPQQPEQQKVEATEEQSNAELESEEPASTVESSESWEPSYVRRKKQRRVKRQVSRGKLREKSVESRSKMAPFLPEKQLWSWADESYRRVGARGRFKKQFHRGIGRRDETIEVGDSAVFLSTSSADRPYIGQIMSMWETSNANMIVKVKWYYHPEERKGSPENLKYPVISLSLAMDYLLIVFALKWKRTFRSGMERNREWNMLARFFSRY